MKTEETGTVYGAEVSWQPRMVWVGEIDEPTCAYIVSIGKLFLSLFFVVSPFVPATSCPITRRLVGAIDFARISIRLQVLIQLTLLFYIVNCIVYRFKFKYRNKDR